MDHEAIRSLIPAHAMGATDGDEGRLLAQHLRSCADCQALLAGYLSLGDDLLYTIPVLAAPEGLGERLRQRVNARRQNAAGGWTGWLRLLGTARAWTAAAAVVLVALVATNVYWFGRVGRLEIESARQAASLASLTSRPAVALYAAAPGAAGRGVVYASAAGDLALLCVYNMPALPADSNYQLWLIKGDQRESGGVFAADSAGYGVLLLKPSLPFGDYDALGITIEPAGGSPKPTTPRVLGTEEQYSALNRWSA